MKKWWIVITVIGAIIFQALTRVLWPMSMDSAMPMPNSVQLPFFITLSFIESIAFGIGIAFLIFGRRLVDSVTEKSKKLAWAEYLSTGWLLIAWWPHSNLHRVNGMNLQGMLYIDYGFHLTLIIAGLILAYAFFHPLQDTK